MAQRAKTVAIIGAGLIGQGWAISFALAGWQVRLFDAAQATGALFDPLAAMARALGQMEDAGLATDAAAALARCQICASLAEAVAQADYVQESVLETVEAKTAVSAQIDACLPDDVLVGSSSSGIPASAFTQALANRAQFFIVHPVNPPQLVPVVEIVPAPWSDTARIGELRAMLEGIGKSAMLVEREIDGFILNRLQGALLNEAWALYEEGYASAADIDRTVRDGLGLRWAFMGPFETISLNAPGGIADYAARLGPLYKSMLRPGLTPDAWGPATAAKLSAELGEAGSDQAANIARRDARLMALAALKARE